MLNSDIELSNDEISEYECHEDHEKGVIVCSRVKKFVRRGVEYEINDDNQAEIINDMIRDLYLDSSRMSVQSKRRASILRFIAILSSLLVIICGVVIGALSILDGNKAAVYAAGILGGLITAIETAKSLFSVENRSFNLKEASIILREVARELRLLEVWDLPLDEKIRRLNDLYDRVDKIDLSIFSNTFNRGSSKTKSKQPESQTLAVQPDRGKPGRLATKSTDDPHKRTTKNFERSYQSQSNQLQSNQSQSDQSQSDQSQSDQSQSNHELSYNDRLDYDDPRDPIGLRRQGVSELDRAETNV